MRITKQKNLLKPKQHYQKIADNYSEGRLYMAVDLQVKAILGGRVTTEQTEAIVHCDPRSLALGTCKGPKPIQETEKREFIAGLAAIPSLLVTDPKANWQLRLQAGVYQYFTPLDTSPTLGIGVGHSPSRLNLSTQFLYGILEGGPGVLLGLDWRPIQESGLQLGGHFTYQGNPGFLFSAGWHFDFSPNPSKS